MPAPESKLTPELQTRLIALIRAGVPKGVACQGVGIAYRTLGMWRAKAAKGRKPYVAFIAEFDRAESEAQSSILVQLRKHGAKDPKALMWMLEHVYSKRYGRIAEMREAKRLEAQQPERGPIEIQITETLRVADASDTSGVHGPADVGASSVQHGNG